MAYIPFYTEMSLEIVAVQPKSIAEELNVFKWVKLRLSLQKYYLYETKQS
jgi:hypothetical protein